MDNPLANFARERSAAGEMMRWMSSTGFVNTRKFLWVRVWAVGLQFWPLWHAPAKVKGLLLLAPAPDFTDALMWAEMSDEVRQKIMDKGEWQRPSTYGEDPYPITRNLIEDGRKNLILGGPIALSCPVRILQGMADSDVPWQHAMKLVEKIEGNTVITLVRRGDHRLSTEEDLARMQSALDTLVSEI